MYRVFKSYVLFFDFVGFPKIRHEKVVYSNGACISSVLSPTSISTASFFGDDRLIQQQQQQRGYVDDGLGSTNHSVLGRHHLQILDRLYFLPWSLFVCFGVFVFGISIIVTETARLMIDIINK